MNDGELEFKEIINKLKILIENDDKYYDVILLDKQQLANDYDNEIVDIICDCVEEMLQIYLIQEGIYGFVDNGYEGISISR